MTSLPPIAPFPPASLRSGIPSEEWSAFLNAWVTLVQAHLQLPPQEFSVAAKGDSPLPAFLVSYFHEFSRTTPGDPYFQSSEAAELKRLCFLLCHRSLSADQVPARLLEWTFLADLSHVLLRSARLRDLIHSVWKRKSHEIEPGLQRLKNSLTKVLDSPDPAAAEDDLKQIVSLLHVSHDIGEFFIVGSDFLDALCAGYVKATPQFRPKIVAVALLGLSSLTKGEKPKYSLLSDHLYSLKNNAEALPKSGVPGSLLCDLVTNTPLLSRIRDSVTGNEGTRAKNLAASLSTFKDPSITRPKKLLRRKVDKGKGKNDHDEYGHGALGGVHVHRMSLITQVQDLFPDLGSAFVIKLLDEYNDDVEQVTAHLLDNSLPPHLDAADRSANIDTSTRETPVDYASHLPPRSTPPPQRRNVFDNDEFDRLAVDASRLHIGRKNEKLTADAILYDRQAAPAKASILSALAAFDADDDERDDSYDIEDVGGTVDNAIPGNVEDAELRDRNEEALFRAYSMSRDVFKRDAATRRSRAREALRSETGMTNETIEGWAIMAERDPRKLRRLEAKFSAFTGRQQELPSTAYRESPVESGAEDSEGFGGRGGRGGLRGGGPGRGRGRGGRGGGGGGSVAGPSDDKATQASRQRKEANKGSRANHNRREGRAQKMAKGGFPG
ncbi:hypothetical protein K490DRAFT_46819 [Saccharata proteae CBS 121410]|uniref:CUE domain-containing protein n=1 Tax=Saccharata proteae CBS 121410 TaxID=1314787 RepID=A0A9P4HP76_9PEZI|nr:hypothetical protein K490DRAFT_46819 [Saccharata proteae CBS 121410]